MWQWLLLIFDLGIFIVMLVVRVCIFLKIFIFIIGVLLVVISMIMVLLMVWFMLIISVEKMFGLVVRIIMWVSVCQGVVFRVRELQVRLCGMLKMVFLVIEKIFGIIVKFIVSLMIRVLCWLQVMFRLWFSQRCMLLLKKVVFRCGFSYRVKVLMVSIIGISRVVFQLVGRFRWICLGRWFQSRLVRRMFSGVSNSRLNIFGRWFLMQGVRNRLVKKLRIIVGSVFISLIIGLILWCIVGVMKQVVQMVVVMVSGVVRIIVQKVVLSVLKVSGERFSFGLKLVVVVVDCQMQVGLLQFLYQILFQSVFQEIFGCGLFRVKWWILLFCFSSRWLVCGDRVMILEELVIGWISRVWCVVLWKMLRLFFLFRVMKFLCCCFGVMVLIGVLFRLKL